MIFEIYDKVRERLLSPEELEGQYYFTGQFDRAYPDPGEYIEQFKINLLTGKIQTEFDISICGDSSCCGEFGSNVLFIDSDDFELRIKPQPIKNNEV